MTAMLAGAGRDACRESGMERTGDGGTAVWRSHRGGKTPAVAMPEAVRSKVEGDVNGSHRVSICFDGRVCAG